MIENSAQSSYYKYAAALGNFIQDLDFSSIDSLAVLIDKVRHSKNRIYICGNGGSAANANHIANDFVSCDIDIVSLSANQSVMTCIANDQGYQEVFAGQLINCNKGDLLIVLSGSGNSKNIVRAIEKSKELGIDSVAIVGYSGGKVKEMATHCIHCPIDDMQIAEDCQLIIGHMVMQYLRQEHGY